MECKTMIWIDLDNSPHVVFFRPIISMLCNLGCNIIITARDCSQTCALAELFGLEYQRIGRHYGKNKILKVAGVLFRGLQLSASLRKKRPLLALSHGSRGQLVAAKILGIPSITILDYEHANWFLKPTWIMMPEIIPVDSIRHDANCILRYPGIKEDVYVGQARPVEDIPGELGIAPDEIVVTMRPPASQAHYHKPESDQLFSEAVNYLSGVPNVRMIIMARYAEQEGMIRRDWPDLCRSARIIIPERVFDGLSLIENSDLVVSGGGTMNREAAAMGVPVYSIFRGRIGAVDRYLASVGRLVLIECAADVRRKIKVEKKHPSSVITRGNDATLKVIIDHIAKVVEIEAKRKFRHGKPVIAHTEQHPRSARTDQKEFP
jgi:predicted glycosyltransferase